LRSLLAVVLSLSVLAACGGGGGGRGAAGDGKYIVGGKIYGLLVPSTELVLQNNGSDDLSRSSNGTFVFATKIADKAGYSVTIKTQPDGQTCKANNNAGTVSGANVTTVSIVCTVKWTWTQQLGVPGLATASAGVAVDPAGYVYVAGTTEGGLDGNGLVGTSDFFVTKYTSTGGKVWIQQLGVAGQDTHATGVAVDPDGNVYVSGDTNGGLPGNALIGTHDIFVTRYSTTGTRVWIKQLGVSGRITESHGVAVDPSGNAYVAGKTDGGLDGNILTGNADLFVTKVSSTGSIVWTRMLGASAKETSAEGVAVDPAGNVYVAGYTDGGLDGTLVGTIDLFLTKYTSTGDLIRTRQLGVSGKDTIANGVAADITGNAYVTGRTNGGLDGNILTGTADLFVATYDGSGNNVRVKQLGASGKYTEGHRVAVDASGNVYVSGYTDGGLDGNARALTGNGDFFVTKYDPAGNKLRTKQWGPANATGVAVGPDNDVYVTGLTSSALEGSTITGTTDLFLVKDDPLGSFP